MKKAFCLLLAAVLCLSALPVFAAADPWEDITLFIPDRVEKLHLTEMPEIPELDVPVVHCWMDTLGDGTTCPVVADPDGDFHVQFDTPVDSCEVDDYPVILDENGYGSIAAELTAMQMITVTATVGGATYDFYTSGALFGAEVVEGGNTFYYDENGVCYWIEVEELDKDYFQSGIIGDKTTITWDRVVLNKKIPGKKNPEKEVVWYVSSILVEYEDYSFGDAWYVSSDSSIKPLHRAGADYFNDEHHTLDSYFITYNVNPVTPGGKTFKQKRPDRYAITYSGHTYDCGTDPDDRVHYDEDQILKGYLEDLYPPIVTISAYGIFSGALYKNGSGKYFGSDKWVKLTDATFYKGKKQLRRLDSFRTLRVEE